MRFWHYTGYEHRCMSPWLAAVTYFALVFGAGFILGTLRIILVAPKVGAVAATLIELPAMLAASWCVARVLMRRLRSPRRTSDAVIVGWIAFGLLMSAELALGVWGFGRTLPEQMQAWASPEGLLGLVGQLVFALMPHWVTVSSRSPLSHNEDA